MNYTILHCHSMLSNCITNIDSTTRYDQYIDRAYDCGMSAMAISEHGSVMSWYNKKTAIEKVGMKYIHAEEFYVTKTLDEKVRDNYHCLLIAKNHEGFLELNTLSSKSFNRDDNSFYYVPRISYEDLKNTSDNIIVSTACLGGILNKADRDMKNDFVRWLHQHTDRCFLELQPHLDDDQVKYNQKLYEIHQKTGIPLLMCTDTHALNQKHIEARKILQKAKNIHFDGEDKFHLEFLTYDELVDLCKQQNALPNDIYLEAIENTNRIADMIEPFEIDYSYKYPHLWGDDSERLFKKKIKEGLYNRGVDKFPNRKEYVERIKYELKAYEHNQAIDFMLLMADIVDWCKTQDIQVGYGRGSCNGSVIAWLLGITEMDSIKHGLNFDRFMNVERVSLSDIDTDFPPSRINEVKEYIFNRHGLHCSDIVTFNTIALKGAIRDVGRALEMSLNVVGDICDRVESQEEDLRQQCPELFKYVDMVNGCIVSVGNHPCGLVCAPHSIIDKLGTFTTSTDTVPISQVNMKEIDAMNYVKLDLLKLDTIELINETCKLANIDRLTPDNMDITDVEVWDSIRDDTTGIFQWEGITGDDYIKKLLSDDNIHNLQKIDKDIDRMTLLSIGNSAIRPAGASYRDDLANGVIRTSGSQAIDDFLKPTFGYLCFQEQIIQFLHEYCGYTMGEADVVRRCVDENTLITMSNGKRKKIKHINEGDKVLTVNKYNGVQYNRVNKVYNNGIKRLIEVETKQDHLIKVTPEHQVLTQDGWKQAKELTTEDYLMTPKNNLGESDELPPSKRLSCTDMFLIGILIGDGSIGNKTDLHFTNSDYLLIEEFKKCVNKRLRNKEDCEFTQYKVAGVDVDCVYSVYVASKNYKESVWNMLQSNGATGFANAKHISSNLMLYPCGEKLYSMLGGLFSTDGGYVKQSKSIEYYTISEELAYDIQFLLGKCNIYSYVYKCKVKDYDYYCYKVRINQINAINTFSKIILPFIIGNKHDEFSKIIKAKNKTGATNNAYNFMLPNDCIKEICECSQRNGFSLRSLGVESGMNAYSGITDIKARRLIEKIYCPKTYKLLNSNLVPLKIKSIKEIKSGNVYDMEIEENHNYVANGLIVHNCFAKKYGTEQCIPKIKAGFIATMKEKYNMPQDEAEQTIVAFLQVIMDASRYLFSLNHSQPYSYEGYASGWLRYYYPLEFLTVALNINTDKEEKTKSLTNYAHKNGISILSPKFGYSTDMYAFDKFTNSIYKGISSIKNLNSKCGLELYALKDNHYDTFFDLLNDVKNTSVNSRQLDILIKIDFFEEYGDINSLLEAVDIYNKYSSCKQIKKEKINDFELPIIRQCSGKESDKMFKDIDNKKLIKILYDNMSVAPTTIYDKISYQIQLLGYTDIIDTTFDEFIYAVESTETNQWGTVFASLYCISDGKREQFKVDKKYYKDFPFEIGNVLKCAFRSKEKRRKINDEWIATGEYETILSVYSKIS